MTNIFGIPIVIAIILGIIFPYTAISLMPYGVAFLFILMMSAGITIDWRKLRYFTYRLPELLIGLVFLFAIFPIGQWLIARWLVTDDQFLYGLVFASLCPVAIVAPYFSNLIEADDEFAFVLMIWSMILCPLIAPIMLKILLQPSVALNVLPLTKYMLLLVTTPIALSYAIDRVFPRCKVILRPLLGLLNMGSLSVLIFILFGTAVGRLNLHYTPINDLFVLLFLMFLQDFGVLVVARRIFSFWLSPEIVGPVSISL
ncbi:MAG: hypothetical protein OEQ39_12090, partial [Gammaproteobacteria bacterium]|nr:hypothetical protein [Gammaproteobacteria bacterium]